MPFLAEQPLFKLHVYDCCKAIIDGRIKDLQRKLTDLREMAAAETKSTAGDKYETARAMLHQEQEQASVQLAALQAQLSLLQKSNPRIRHSRIVQGTLIYTDKGIFFISTGLGKMMVNDTPVWAISLQSPLGKAFAGYTADTIVVFNNSTYAIIQIL